MALNPDDEEQFRQISDVETARLALRGALSTIRDLQDLSSRLKGEVQDAVNKEKMASQQAAELKSQIEGWQKEVARREQEAKQQEEKLDNFKDKIRLEVRDEERSQIVADRQQMEEELARLASSMAEMRRLQQQKEEEWKGLKRAIEERDLEVLKLQREKLELSNRFQQDAETVQRLRQKRDEEIQAIFKSREGEITGQERLIGELRRKVDELSKVSAAQSQEADIRMQEKEESLVREYRAKELALQEKFARREAEMQGAWSEMEQGLWKRAKEAREKLDLAIGAQFEERARALADRSREIDAILKSRQQDLDEEFRNKLDLVEKEYTEKERRLLDGFTRREAELLKKFDAEIAKEKAILLDQHREREKELELEHHAAMGQVALRQAELDREVERHRQRLDREFADKEANAQLAFQGKEQALEAAYQKKDVELHEGILAKENELREEWTRRKTELLAEHERAIEAERAVLKTQLDAESRRFEEAYRIRVAELDKAHKTLEDQYRTWKATVLDEYVQKEKNLDKQWYVREQELIRKYEIALEQERNAAKLELEKTKEQFEDIRKRAEEDFYARAEGIRQNGEHRLREQTVESQKREEELRNKHQTEIQAELKRQREHYEALLAQQKRHFEGEAAGKDANRDVILSRMREDHERAAQELESKLAEQDRTLHEAQEKLVRLNAEHQALWEDLWARERKKEADRLVLENSVKEREAQREQKYLELERQLQQIWAQKEQEYLAMHREALEKQHRGFADEVKRLEEERGKERELHAQEIVLREDKSGEKFEEWRNAAMRDLNAEKEAWMERQRRASIQEKTLLQQQFKQMQDSLAAEQSRKEGELDQRRQALEDFYRKREESLEQDWRKRMLRNPLPPDAAAYLAGGQKDAEASRKQVSEEFRQRMAALHEELEKKEAKLKADRAGMEAELSKREEASRQHVSQEISKQVEAKLQVKELELSADFAARLEQEKRRVQEESERGFAQQESKLAARARETLDREREAISAELTTDFKIRLEQERRRIFEEAEKNLTEQQAKLAARHQGALERDRQAMKAELEADSRIRLEQERRRLQEEAEKMLSEQQANLFNRNKEMLEREREMLEAEIETSSKGHLEKERRRIREEALERLAKEEAHLAARQKDVLERERQALKADLQSDFERRFEQERRRVQEEAAKKVSEREVDIVERNRRLFEAEKQALASRAEEELKVRLERERKRLDDDAEKALAQVKAERVDLEQLISFTAPLVLRTIPAKIEEVMSGIVSEILEPCGAKGLRLVRQDAPEKNLAVLSDAPRLRTALLHLIANSIDATPSGGTLTLTTRLSPARDAVEIEIVDTGVGVAPQYLAEIGRPFFTTKPGGVGLGVAIATRILQAHGGSFRFESRQGRGSRAVCRLPILKQ